MTIFSLTDKGEKIALKLLAYNNSATHLHKPTEFTETVQRHFTDGNQCIFICAIGIVIRTLAPVLTDKHTDPAVIAIDEKGKYVIPLLSGHEGGANVLANKIANHLQAKLVITSAKDYTQPVYTLGMGCDKGCPLDVLAELYNEAKQLIDDSIILDSIASIDLKKNENGLLSLASTLDLPFKCYNAELLRTVEQQLSVKSDIVYNEVGCYGVAEAAALIAASEQTKKPSELLLTKIKNKRATLAIARSYY